MKIRATFAVMLIIFSCNSDREQLTSSFSPRVVQAHGDTLFTDRMPEPKIVPAGKPRIVPAGRPSVVLIKSIIHPAGIPKVVMAGIPRICTPGKDSFSLPKIIPAIHRPFIAGIPQVIAAKEAQRGEQNPEGFSSFGVLEGLKGDASCLFEDKKGNLWFGGSGVGKYDGKSFSYFTVKEGLSNNLVRGILEDKYGNFWFATHGGGVNKYDGKSFTHFTTKEGLSNNFVADIVEDQEGHLWFGTDKGADKYDGKSFTHFTAKTGFTDRHVGSIGKDKSGNLWFGTVDGGIKYDGKSFTHFTDKEGLSDNVISSIAEDKSGNLWFGTNTGGISKYDGKTFTHFASKQGLHANDVLRILADKNGNLWITTYSGGISKYDGRSFTHFTKNEGLKTSHIAAILEDQHHNIWFGGVGPMIRYDGESFTHSTEKEGLTHYPISSVLEDKSGNLWIGTRGGGVTKFNGKSFTHVADKEGRMNSYVWSILEDRSGNLWFGTFRGVYKYDGKDFTFYTEIEGLRNEDVKCILEDKNGNLWFGATGSVSKYDGKGFTHFTEREGLNKDFSFCYSVLEDRSGNLWFGTDKGVTKYDGKSFIRFTETEGLSNNIVKSILEDQNGNLWFGTESGGITKYDGKSFTRFTEKEGLNSNDIKSSIEDKRGDIWFATALGLSKLEKHKIAYFPKAKTDDTDSSESAPFFKTYSYDDGFSGIGANFGKTLCEAKDGTLWIGTQDRLTAFHPGKKAPDTIAPHIQVTGITLFNENIPWQNLLAYPEGGNGRPIPKDTGIVLGNGVLLQDYRFDDVSRWYGIPERLSLAYSNNYLTFQFVGITIQSSKKVKYQYKLEGLDDNWSALTDRSEAPYNNLPHGKYTFKVKAMSADGYWSNEFNYTFTIRPPWWQTWWAYLLFGLLFTGFVYALFRYRLSTIRTQHELQLQKHKASELEMQALRAQMNPHFIFNSLNSINRFILKNDKSQASRYLTKFSRLVRLILQNSREAFIPLERELEALQLYLELESLRFEQKFEYKISVGKEVDANNFKVPPLLIQPFAENAIWHGLMHKEETGHLAIELYLVEKVLHCKICDDGIGRKKAAELKSKSAYINNSMGMRITEDRIANLQREPQQGIHLVVTDIVLDDGSAGGTEVIIKIPVSYD